MFSSTCRPHFYVAVFQQKDNTQKDGNIGLLFVLVGKTVLFSSLLNLNKHNKAVNNKIVLYVHKWINTIQKFKKIIILR